MYLQHKTKAQSEVYFIRDRRVRSFELIKLFAAAFGSFLSNNLVCMHTQVVCSYANSFT
jgi:hypothetical protein